MTDPASSPVPPTEPPRRFSAKRVGFAAAALAALGIALYGTGIVSSNPASAECKAASAIAERLKPLARGDVAAFAPAAVPAKLPDLTFKRPDGADVTLADFKGRTVLLNLWATWCAPCRAEMPALDRLQADAGSKDFEVVAVNIDVRNLERPKAWLAEREVKTLAYYSDPSAKLFQDLKALGKAFGMPTTLLIDRNGCELGIINGPAEWAGTDARKLIETALGKTS